MRKADHQLTAAAVRDSVWQKADSAKYPYSPENTGMTLAPAEGVPQLRLQHAEPVAR
jgi:branched-chain amino acid transport system substrate-binding protein